MSIRQDGLLQKSAYLTVLLSEDQCRTNSAAGAERHSGTSLGIWPGLEVYSYSENGRQGKEFPLLFHCVCIVVE